MRVSVGLVASMMLSACGADSPLDALPHEKLDERLLGEWHCVASDKSQSLWMMVTADSERVYQLEFRDPGKEAPEHDRAYFSHFEGLKLLNVHSYGYNRSGEWFFTQLVWATRDVFGANFFKVDFTDADTTTPERLRMYLTQQRKQHKAELIPLYACIRAWHG